MTIIEKSLGQMKTNKSGGTGNKHTVLGRLGGWHYGCFNKSIPLKWTKGGLPMG
jgi:hypothetical protein